MGILQDSLVVEATYLGQSPANSLCRPALHLPFNMVRIDAQADVLKRRIAQDCDLAGVAVDLHIGHMHLRIRRDSYTTKRFAGAAIGHDGGLATHGALGDSSQGDGPLWRALDPEALALVHDVL